LAEEVVDPTAIYKSISAWRERSLVALSHATPSLALRAIEFEAATRELTLPDPELPESWDVWQFEESVRKAAAILVGAAAELDRQAAIANGPVTPDAVRNAIASALAEHVKSYDLPGICVGLGLSAGDESEAFSSKRVYVKSRLIEKRGDDLLEIGRMVMDDYGDVELGDLLQRFRAQLGIHASPGAALVGESLSLFTDWSGVQRTWTAALEKVVSDPDGAITAARTMLESVCKHICDERGVTYESGWDLSRLYKAAASAMNVAPDQHAEQVIKQILSGVSSVVGGLAALRNSMSDAHGQGKRSVRPAPRHAKLAVNAAFAVRGHEKVRTYGHEKSARVATRSPQLWPSDVLTPR
jgi:hypothetical protein